MIPTNPATVMTVLKAGRNLGPERSRFAGIPYLAIAKGEVSGLEEILGTKGMLGPANAFCKIQYGQPQRRGPAPGRKSLPKRGEDGFPVHGGGINS